MHNNGVRDFVCIGCALHRRHTCQPRARDRSGRYFVLYPTL